jgi:CRISPR/Cas system type I-B associated protein Csh2 (Cas7 group RAMP superfamily)
MVMAQKVRQRLWNGVRNIPVRARKGGAGSKKIVFLYDRSHQLVENKGRRVQNEAKNEAKIDLNEAKLEAKRAKTAPFAQNEAKISGRKGRL